jgi:hypothetical protein
MGNDGDGQDLYSPAALPSLYQNLTMKYIILAS